MFRLVPSKLLSFRLPNGFNLVNNFVVRQYSDLKHATSTHHLWPNLRSTYIPDEMVHHHMKNAYVLDRLAELLELAQTEAKYGRWCVPRTVTSNDKKTILDRFLMDALISQLGLDGRTAIKLIRFVCAEDISLPDFASVQSPNTDPIRFRLELLNPSRLQIQLFDPLLNAGVQNVCKLLSKCPELILASSIEIPLQSTGADSSQTKQTVLQGALDELSILLPRNDFINVINNFPGVLLKSKQDLLDTFTYLTSDMGLESNESVCAASFRKNRHSMRNSSGLKLSNCSAWCLPMSHTKCRHFLAILAGNWPLPKTGPNEKIKSDEQLKYLLTCSPSRFAYWLNLNSALSIRSHQLPKSTHQEPNSISLSDLDVRTFELMFANIVNVNEKSKFFKLSMMDKTDFDEDDLDQNEDNEED